MIAYNPRNWFGLIFRFHKSDTFRTLFWVMFSVGLYSAAVVYLELEILKWGQESTTAVHALLGFVISLLLVFRTNTAYDRWWEGRKQWGALVNVSRNLAMKIKAFIPVDEEKLRAQLTELNASYASVLRHHLRDEPLEKQKEGLGEAWVHRESDHLPNSLAQDLQEQFLEAYRRGHISEAAYLAILQDVNQFTDICGACERIKKTPIPYTYNIFIKKFIFAFIVTMPIAFVGLLGYWSVGITVFTFYAFASLELIAEEIEDPFGQDANDLPTDDLAQTIANNVRSILH